jgi:hypothetical protein
LVRQEPESVPNRILVKRTKWKRLWRKEEGGERRGEGKRYFDYPIS